MLDAITHTQQWRSAIELYGGEWTLTVVMRLDHSDVYVDLVNSDSNNNRDYFDSNSLCMDPSFWVS